MNFIESRNGPLACSSTPSPPLTFPSPALAHSRFAHAETVIPFLALLGLFRDETPLDVANWAQMEGATAREFRTSALAPFAANIAIVLYTNTAEPAAAPPLVKLIVNEREVPFPVCASAAASTQGNVYCPLSSVIDAYKEFVGDGCDFDAMCALSS